MSQWPPSRPSLKIEKPRQLATARVPPSAYPVQMLAEFASLKRILREDLRTKEQTWSLSAPACARASALLEVLRDAIVRGQREIDFRSPSVPVDPTSSERTEWDEVVQTDATGRIFNAIDLVSRYGMKVRHNLEPEFRELQVQIHLLVQLRQIEQVIRSYREAPFHTSAGDPVGYEWAIRIVRELQRTVEGGGAVAHLSQRSRPQWVLGASSVAVRQRGMIHCYWRQVQRAIGLFEGYNFQIQWSSLPDEKFTWAPAPAVEFTEAAVEDLPSSWQL